MNDVLLKLTQNKVSIPLKDVDRILEKQRENALSEAELWHGQLENMGPIENNLDSVKALLFALSQCTKAVRRYGQLIGLDENK